MSDIEAAAVNNIGYIIYAGVIEQPESLREASVQLRLLRD